MKKSELARKLVEKGECNIFTNWHDHTGVSAEDFIAAVKWLEEDPFETFEAHNDEGKPIQIKRMTREIRCREDGTIEKLRRVNDANGCFVGFYNEDGKHVQGQPMMLNIRDRI